MSAAIVAPQVRSDLLETENALRARGYAAICGVDEAGAGPLAGPVYAAAVILDPARPVEGLRDSKKLSERQRERLFAAIDDNAAAWSAAFVSESEIDEINILQARLKAMRLAVGSLKIKPGFILVDGDKDPGFDCETMTITGGDGKSACIAAASIVAKVLRDRFMTGIAEKYPLYLFEKHKGYGTALHMSRLREHGPCPIHRLSFLKKL
jgi:ribonuclease HII